MKQHVQPRPASSLHARDDVLEAGEALAVGQAALRYERVLRDGALQRYERAKLAYESACVARERRRLLEESHEFTQTELKRAVERIRALVHRSCPAKREGAVRESTVSAAALLVSSARYDRAEHGLRALVAQEIRFQGMREFMPSTDTQDGLRTPARESGASPLPCSNRGDAVGPVVMTVVPSMRPLLLLAATRLGHASLLQDGRHSLCSRLACAQRLLNARAEGRRSPSSPLHGTDLARCRAQVSEARDAFARTTALQRSVTARLYELHQWLARRVPVHSRRGIYVDAGAADAVQRQLRSELAAGRVTLLRLLCESGPVAFDNEGQLRLDL